MDEHLTFKNEGNLSLEQAATVGVGLLVSSPLPEMRGLEGVLMEATDSFPWTHQRDENRVGGEERR
jgi:hypothetical protein